MTQPEGKKSASPRQDAFASVAFWQLMSFMILLCFVWAAEIFDLSAILFGTPATPFNFFRACILSAAVIASGVIAVGHTYEAQKSLIKKMLKTCLYCHRIKLDDATWVHMDEYFVNHFPMSVDHCSCPDCQQMLKSIDEKGAKA